MPGMTFKSMSAALFGLLLMAVTVQLFGIFGAGPGAVYGTEAIPLDALITFSCVYVIRSGS